MKLTDDLFNQLLQRCLTDALAKILPDSIKEVLQKHPGVFGQDFISLEEAVRRYDISRKTLYNYHNRGNITLHSSGGRTFVSVSNLEAYIRGNPLARSEGKID